MLKYTFLGQLTFPKAEQIAHYLCQRAPMTQSSMVPLPRLSLSLSFGSLPR